MLHIFHCNLNALIIILEGEAKKYHLFIIIIISWNKHTDLYEYLLITEFKPAPIDDGHAFATENIPGANFPREAGAGHH